MTVWPSPLVDQLRSAVCGDPIWDDLLSHLGGPEPLSLGVHVAILVEPYLQLILDGHKTVESRFARRECPPYRGVTKDDVILLKRSGGPIVGVCQVADVWFHQRDERAWQPIRDEFAIALCALSPTFWEERADTSFATLMRLIHVRGFTPGIGFAKRDRRGWVILQRAGGHVKNG